MKRATKDEAFVTQLIANETTQQTNELLEAPEEIDENAVDNTDKLKIFIWPDKAVLLLLELYREREDFSIGLKQNNKIWNDIAVEMKKANFSYNVTAQQCASNVRFKADI